jgi:hypothetical protein
LGPIERRQWVVLLGIFSFLVGWNYWFDRFFITSLFGLFGDGFNDFEIYRLAGVAWLSHGSPYVASPGFIYPPTSVPFFALYASVPFHSAGQLWWITYFAFFVVACISLWLTLKGADRRLLFATIVALLFFTSYPLLVNFELGQVDLLTAALASMSLAFQRSKHGFASAVMLSLAALLKGPAALLLVYFVLFRRDVSYLLHFLLSVFVIIGASLLIVPVGDYWYYLSHVIPSQLGVPTTYAYVASAVSVGGFILFTFFSFWGGARQLPFGQKSLSADAMFLFNVLAMLLFAPTRANEVHPYVWVIVPLALFLSAVLMDHIRSGYLALVSVGVFLLNSNLAPSILSCGMFPFEVVGNIMVCLCLLLFYIRPITIIDSAGVGHLGGAHQRYHTHFLTTNETG